MTLPLLLSLTGIAVLDSLNPSLFIAQFYLFTTPRPVPRITSYIAGILTVNFGSGILILGGVRAVIADFLGSMGDTTLYSLQFILGIALLGFGLWYKAGGKVETEAKKPQSLGMIYAFGFGMVIMLNEITTALPYFVAIEQMAQAQLNALQSLSALAVYNLVFSLPLFAFLGLYVRYRDRFAAQLNSISQWIHIWTPRLMKYACIIFGGLLALNAALYLINETNLFR